MMKFMYKAIVLVVMIGASVPTLAATRDLTTTYATNNAAYGNVFNLTANVPLTIKSFDVHLSNQGANAVISVYSRQGPAQGFESNPSGWTLLGTANVVSRGQGVATPVPVGGLALAAGRTYGIYISTSPSVTMLYTNGSNTYSNDDLSLTTLYGKSAPDFFSSTFSPRQWNGTIHYGVFTSCAAEGFSGTKLTLCKQICETRYPTTTLNALIKAWVLLYRTDPPCAR